LALSKLYRKKTSTEPVIVGVELTAGETAVESDCANPEK